MSWLALTLYLSPMVALIAASAFFSGSETALFSLGQPTLTRWERQGNRLQRLVAHLMRDHHGVLIAILLANNFVNILMAVLTARLTEHWLGDTGGPIAAGLLVTVVLLVFGEVTPKTIAYSIAPTLAPRIAVPIYWCQSLFQRLGLIPLLRGVSGWLLSHLSKHDAQPAVTAEEYETFVQLGRDVGVFSRDEADLLACVLRLRGIVASQAMRPRVDVQAVDVGLDEAQLMARVAQCRHRLLPVIAGSLDKVIGVLQVRTFIMGSPAMRSDWRSTCLLPPLYVPENAPLTKVLELLRQNRQRMAFVVDEYGGVEGLLTVEDIIEEIIGEVESEFNQPTWSLTELGPGRWRVNGTLPLHQLTDEIPVPLAEEESVDTIGGLIAQELGHLPAVGECWDCGSYRFRVRRLDRRRVLDLDLTDTRLHPEETP